MSLAEIVNSQIDLDSLGSPDNFLRLELSSNWNYA